MPSRLTVGRCRVGCAGRTDAIQLFRCGSAAIDTAGTEGWRLDIG